MLFRNSSIFMYHICSRKSSTYYDTVIVGGGMVGNAMAASLGTSPGFNGKKILLLEGGDVKSLPTTAPAIYSNRVSAVSPTSIDLFKKVDIWDRLLAYRVKKVDKLHVIDSFSRAQIEFDQSNRNSEIAYLIENDAIVGALFERIDKCKNVTIRSGAKLEECSFPSDLNNLATLKLAGGESIETSLVIGADGFRSRVRESMGVDYTSWNYEQMGLVATLRVETERDNSVAWQRFTRLGPIALLPLSKDILSDISSLVWTTSPEEAQRLKSLPIDQFVDELNEALLTEQDQNEYVNQALFTAAKVVDTVCPGHKATPLPPHIIGVQSDTRAAFPLGFGHSHSYIGIRGALIGDAAHRVHPLAGQGVNLGWNDVIQLTRVLENTVEQGAELGSLTYLKDYDTSAQRHNVPVMVSIDWLNRLYRTDAPLVVMARSFGLSAINAMTPLKDLLVYQLSKGVTR